MLFRLFLLLIVVSIYISAAINAQAPFPTPTYSCIACPLQVCASIAPVTLYVSQYYNLNATQVCNAINYAVGVKYTATSSSSSCQTISGTNTCGLLHQVSTLGYLSNATCTTGGTAFIDGYWEALGSNFTVNIAAGQFGTQPSNCALELQCVASPLNNTYYNLGYCTKPSKALILYGAQQLGYGFSNYTPPGAGCVPCHISPCDQYGYNLDVYLGSYANLSVSQVCSIAQSTTTIRLNSLIQNANTYQCLQKSIYNYVCDVFAEMESLITNADVCAFGYIDQLVASLDSTYATDCQAELNCLLPNVSSQLATAGYCTYPSESLILYGAALNGWSIESKNNSCYSCSVTACQATISISAPNAAAAATLCAAANIDYSFFLQHTVSTACNASFQSLVCEGLQLAQYTEYGCDIGTIGQGTDDANTTIFTQGCLGLAHTCLDNIVGPALIQSGACNGFSQFLSALTAFQQLALPSSSSSSTGVRGSSSGGPGNGVHPQLVVYSSAMAVMILVLVLSLVTFREF